MYTCPHTSVRTVEIQQLSAIYMLPALQFLQKKKSVINIYCFFFYIKIIFRI